MKQYIFLSEIQNDLIRMRFKENRTLFDIAQRLKLTWDQTDALLEETLDQLYIHAVGEVA